jgi:hypothetical protein
MKQTIAFIAFLLVAISVCKAQQSDLVNAANNFIKSLDNQQKAKAVYPFDSDERYNFHFVPLDNRKGISINELSDAQHQAAMSLLRASLSSEAFQKTQDIMQLEPVLKAIEHREASDHYRDPGKYFFTIFGVPGPKNTWGWRIDGHHITFSFSAENNKLVSGTPGFLGANPAIVLDGPQKGKQVLKNETEMAFDLLHSFSAEQMKDILIDSTAPNDIFTFNKRKAMIEHPFGITWSKMNSAQQQNMLKLISLYVHRYTKLFADDMMKEIQVAGLDSLRFAWAGFREPGLGKAHYYRIQGPTILIEYDNSQNNANHVHSVIRDLKHDFGGDELMEHYKAGHATSN